ncbi:MAG TPA: hypothetical protein VK689_10825 [Armatimonadota bacterium]|nr:hypothetical protein [Armatimonadota bacterium]
MIRGWNDVIALGVLGLLLIAFGLISSGYLVLLREAFASPDRARMLRLVWDWRGHEHELDPRGLRLIFSGAAIGAVVFSVAFLVSVVVILR